MHQVLEMVVFAVQEKSAKKLLLLLKASFLPEVVKSSLHQKKTTNTIYKKVSNILVILNEVIKKVTVNR